ncbi:hypothetical protein D3C73_1455440 [compost metagenome]
MEFVWQAFNEFVECFAGGEVFPDGAFVPACDDSVQSNVIVLLDLHAGVGVGEPDHHAFGVLAWWGRECLGQ